MCNDCNCKETNLIDKNELLNYSFYDESHKLTAVLNEDRLKQIFNADNVIFFETEHK